MKKIIYFLLGLSILFLVILLLLLLCLGKFINLSPPFINKKVMVNILSLSEKFISFGSSNDKTYFVEDENTFKEV